MTALKVRVVPASFGPTRPWAWSPWHAEQPRSTKSILPRTGSPINPFAGLGGDATHSSPAAPAIAVAAIWLTVNATAAAGVVVAVGAARCVGVAMAVGVDVGEGMGIVVVTGDG